jgi:anti-anti-sigma factor
MEIQPVIVRLAGDYDAYNSDELRRLLEPACDGADVVIDFTGARYVDSSCLTELAQVRRQRLDGGLPVMRLVIPNRNMRKIFEIVGFDQVFPLFESLEEALGDGSAR